MSCLINPNAQRLLSTLNPVINLFLTKRFFYYLFFKLNTYLIFINFLFTFLNKFNYNTFFLFWFNNFKIINLNLIIYFSKKLNFFIKEDDEDAKNQSLIQLKLKRIISSKLIDQTFNDFNDIINSKIATFLVNWAHKNVKKEKKAFTEVDKERAEKAKFDFRKIRFFYSFFSKKKFYFLKKNLSVPWTYWFLIYQNFNTRNLIKVYKKKHYTYRNYWAKVKISRFHPGIHFLYSSSNLSNRKSWFNLRKFTKPHKFKLKRFVHKFKNRNELVVNRLDFFQHYKFEWKKPFFFLPKKFWRKWWNNWFVRKNYWTEISELQFYLRKRRNLHRKNIRNSLAQYFYNLWLKKTRYERFGLKSLKKNFTANSWKKYKLLSTNLKKKTQYYKKLWKKKEFNCLYKLPKKNYKKLPSKKILKKSKIISNKKFNLNIKKNKIKSNILTFFKQKIFYKLQKKSNLKQRKSPIYLKSKNLLFFNLIKNTSSWTTKFNFCILKKKNLYFFNFKFFWKLLNFQFNQFSLINNKLLYHLFFHSSLINLNSIIWKKKCIQKSIKKTLYNLKIANYLVPLKKITNSLLKKKKKNLRKKFNKKILKIKNNFINFLFVNSHFFKKKPYYVSLLEINLTTLVFFSFIFFPILSFYKSLFAHILHLIFSVNKLKSKNINNVNRFFKTKKSFWKIHFLAVKNYYYSKFSILKFIFFKLSHRRLKVRIFLDQVEKFFSKRTNVFKNNYLKHSITQRKKIHQKRFINSQKKNNQALLGYRIHLSGRITKKDRALYIWESRGKNSLSSQYTKVEYITKSFVTPYSLCTLKLWLRWF